MINQNEKNVDNEVLAQNQLKRTYNERLDNGSDVTISISIEVENVDSNDSGGILCYIAQCSRNFYLYVAGQLSNKP